MKHSVWFFIVAMLLLSACAPITPAAQPAAAMPNPASVFCADNGGTVDIRKDAQGGEYGMCVFADGSECDEWAFFRGECKPGQPAGEQNAGMANPASVFCGENGGTLDIRKDAQDNEYGVCTFADGSECDEWAFFRGECKAGESGEVMNMRNPASVFCAENGGNVDIRDEAEGSAGYCVFADKSECEEWAFFRGECKQGDAPAQP